MEKIQLYANILQEYGLHVSRNAKILDFGCGEGRTVRYYRKLGYEAFGVDIHLIHADDVLRLIPPEKGYRIPFNDETFEFVFSDQVLEHVRDSAIGFAEIGRVLKHGCWSLHIFPSKYRIIEPHIGVPLAGTIQNYYWLLLWAFLGVRNCFQQKSPYKQVAMNNLNYLRDSTGYLSGTEIRNIASEYFDKVLFIEPALIKHSRGPCHHIYPLVKLLPPLASIYGILNHRALLLHKK
jgi:SAM-dependent methyltransferase